jgi:signal transduction histidine kinase
MTEHALRASELERRRIAQELHDGVVQDLAGVGFVLSAVRRELRAVPIPDGARATLDEVGDMVQRDVSALRSMMIDIYPPNLARDGVLAAVHELAEHGSARGLGVRVETSGNLDMPLSSAQIVYRVVREGLHNVVKHAAATRAIVTLRCAHRVLTVRVADDGRGVDETATLDPGHLGLHMLHEALSDFGGRLRLRNGVLGAPGELDGAVLEVRLPPIAG